jgi:hypothetical protein
MEIRAKSRNYYAGDGDRPKVRAAEKNGYA